MQGGYRGTRYGAALPVAVLVSAALSFLVLLHSGPSEARAAISAGQNAYVDVQAATLWSKPYQARSNVDRPSYSNPTNLTAWERNMTRGQKGWLTGKTQTQALYGQEVRVLGTYRRWAKVAVRSQDTPKHRLGYPGWVPQWQLTPRTNADISRGELIAQVESRYGLLYEDRGLGRVDHSVSFGTRLPVTDRASGRVRVADPDGGYHWIRAGQAAFYREGRIQRRAKPNRWKVRRQALDLRGAAYVWAGTGSYGFDCSGLTHQVYRRFGIDIPRDAGGQRRAGDPVRWRDKQPGDLLFFGPGPRNITHVGMYISNGNMVNAPYAGRKVILQNVWRSGRMDEFRGARRYL